MTSYVFGLEFTASGVVTDKDGTVVSDETTEQGGQ